MRRARSREVILEGGVISVQVLNEFTSVMRRKFNLSWDEIAEALEDVKTALDIVRPIDVETHWAAVDALPAPKDSAEHKTAFVRGFTGLREELNAIEARSGGQVGYIGEWHSHPDGAGIGPNADDTALLSTIAEEMRMDGWPGVMMIVGDGGRVGFFVQAW